MDSTNVHLALNHLPVVGVAIATLVLLYGMTRRSEEIQRVALALFVLAAVAVIPVRMTGEGAEEGVERLPGVTESVIERHEEAAGIASPITVALGLTSLGLLFLRWRPAWPWLVRGVAALALVAGALLVWTAHLGGQVRHTEIRATTTASAVDAEPPEVEPDDD